MTKLWWGLLLVGVTGCSSSAVNFEHQSELEVNTRGVRLNEAGNHAIAGMFGTTCRIAVSDGSVGEDYDFPTEDEQVQDAGVLDGEDAVLVVSDLGAHVTFPDRYWDWETDDYGGSQVLEGRFFDAGVVLLDAQGGCSADWYADGVGTSVDLTDDLCVGGTSMTVTDSGRLFAGNGSDVVTATEDGVTSLGAEADLVVWDESAQVLYAALLGSTQLQGIEEDGIVRWTTELEGTIVVLDAMGPLATAAVMIEMPNGTGALLTVDGYTGEVTSSLATPSPAVDVQAAEGGGSLAMVLSREVHFFNVRALP